MNICAKLCLRIISGRSHGFEVKGTLDREPEHTLTPPPGCCGGFNRFVVKVKTMLKREIKCRSTIITSTQCVNQPCLHQFPGEALSGQWAKSSRSERRFTSEATGWIPENVSAHTHIRRKFDKYTIYTNYTICFGPVNEVKGQITCVLHFL